MACVPNRAGDKYIGPGAVFWGPLHCAANSKDVNCVRKLLAQSYSPDQGLLTPLMLACIGKLQNFEALQECTPITLLFQVIPESAEKGSFTLVKELLKAGASPSAQYAGLTPLLLAVANGDPDIVKELIMAGAPVHVKEVHSTQVVGPVMIATMMNNTSVMQVLLQAGANPNEPSQLEDSPLVIASRTRRVGICRLLIDYKADVNSKDRLYRSALWNAANLRGKALPTRVKQVRVVHTHGWLPPGPHCPVNLGHPAQTMHL